ncbi:MAG: NAD(P)H-hydrate dehydratase [Thermodesulfobacteriota bacterium]
MLAVVGTVPDQSFPVVCGRIELKGGELEIGGHRVGVGRGTPALLAAACLTVRHFGAAPVLAHLAGDVGLGDGSRKLYRALVEDLPRADYPVLAFHYLLPDVDWHNQVLFAIEEMIRRPVLIADAGFMYAAKMSGQAPAYDLFTPDIGELAFLADEKAPHPFYTRGFILHEDNRAPDLIARAYEHDNAARYLLVKGGRDYLAGRSGVLETIDSPGVEVLEAIGGTGDTLTGLVAALVSVGFELKEAAVLASRTNRLAGHLARPSPATPITEIVSRIPEALDSLTSRPAKLHQQRSSAAGAPD